LQLTLCKAFERGSNCAARRARDGLQQASYRHQCWGGRGDLTWQWAPADRELFYSSFDLFKFGAYYLNFSSTIQGYIKRISTASIMHLMQNMRISRCFRTNKKAVKCSLLCGLGEKCVLREIFHARQDPSAKPPHPLIQRILCRLFKSST
jgi:hypothetical protein